MITAYELKILASLERAIAYNAGNKAAFSRLAKKLCTSIRSELNLNAEQADVRYNPGGIAVSGEATLHSDTLYLQVSESCTGLGLCVMYRTCKGQQDYTGGMNHFASVARIAERGLPAFVAHLREFLSHGYEPPVWNGAEYRRRAAASQF